MSIILRIGGCTYKFNDDHEDKNEEKLIEILKEKLGWDVKA